MKQDMEINIKQRFIKIKINEGQKQFTIQELPEEFVKWQLEERKKLFKILVEKQQPTFFNPHLPTLLTFDKTKVDFPINAAAKGIGLVPRDDELEELSSSIESILKKLNSSDYEITLQQRIQAAMLLYNNPMKIDFLALGGLEIFETHTYRNIQETPYVSLFFVGTGPHYKSYQINCIAEVVEKEHRFYRFLKNMRNLFEEAQFHFQQPEYPYAIKYHVIEFLDKSLRLRDA